MDQVLHKISKIRLLNNYFILIKFIDGSKKIYDCKPLFNIPSFCLIRNPVFFKAAKIDVGGHGIVWNENIDIDAEELWANGHNANESEMV